MKQAHDYYAQFADTRQSTVEATASNIDKDMSAKITSERTSGTFYAIREIATGRLLNHVNKYEAKTASEAGFSVNIPPRIFPLKKNAKQCLTIWLKGVGYQTFSGKVKHTCPRNRAEYEIVPVFVSVIL